MGTWLYLVQIEKEVQVKSSVLTYVQCVMSIRIVCQVNVQDYYLQMK